MRKTIIAVLCVIALVPLSASGVKDGNEDEIIVFAAASLTETLTEIGDDYQSLHPETEVVFNFDSSGTLKTQIEEGAPCDLFISAAPLQMNQLEALELVDSATRLDLLENKVTLSVSDKGNAGVKAFDELPSMLKKGEILLAIGNSDVPVGQYTEKIFAYFGIDEVAVSSSLTYGSNVKEVTTQVSEGAVDCGIIYATDAYSAGLDVVDEATPEMCGQVIYPAAVMKNAVNHDGAIAFLDYLQCDASIEVFRSVGFSPAF